MYLAPAKRSLAEPVAAYIGGFVTDGNPSGMPSTSNQKPAKPLSLAAAHELAERERLRLALPATVDLLHHRQADQIDNEDIDAYVKLDWLEWHGGGLRLTITGRNVCAQTTSTT